MKVRVLLFAALREKLGKNELVVELPAPCPVSGLQEHLSIDKSLWSSLAFAVNQTYVPANTLLRDGDEVALIPPVAGG
ncbi:MAG TPA: molybdopterin converting factor subunit 1 [bacterium]|nr:molybdopterin converting factor subunit 1 [bacterium]